MYALNFTNSPPQALNSCSQTCLVDFKIWHQWLGHVGDSGLKKLIGRGILDRLDIISTETHGRSKNCICGKQTCRPFDQIIKHEIEILKHIHIDLWGPARVESVGGKQYMMLLTDGVSLFREVFFLTNKKAKTMFEAFKRFTARAELQTRKRLKMIHIDGGGEFVGPWIMFCEEKRIIIETTAPYFSSANGAAKRGIRTVIECTCTLLHDGKLPLRMWVETAMTVVYLLNYIPSAHHPGVCKSPFELFKGMKPDILHL